ncbi:hypothetical protein KCU92_g10131, partial [Aureobasidium melanogenum]
MASSIEQGQGELKKKRKTITRVVESDDEESGEADPIRKGRKMGRARTKNVKQISRRTPSVDREEMSSGESDASSNPETVSGSSGDESEANPENDDNDDDESQWLESEEIPRVEQSTKDLRRHQDFVKLFAINPFDNPECREFVDWIHRFLDPDYNVDLIVWAIRFPIKWHMNHIFVGNGRIDAVPTGIWYRPGQKCSFSDGNWSSPRPFDLHQVKILELDDSISKIFPRLAKWKDKMRVLNVLEGLWLFLRHFPRVRAYYHPRVPVVLVSGPHAIPEEASGDWVETGPLVPFRLDQDERIQADQEQSEHFE